MSDLLIMLGASFMLVMGFSVLLWVISNLKNNAVIADIGWAVSFLISVWVYQLLGNGNFGKSIVLSAMVSLWAFRLANDLWARFDWNHEDGRYTRMRNNWGGDPTKLLFLAMFIFQGFLTLVLSIPFLIIANWGTPDWSWWEGIGVLTWAVGLAGECTADRQLIRFKQNPENSGKVCEDGLWAYSRHPNYFFEWIVWCGFAIYVFPAPGGWLGLIGPVIMYILLVKVSGIPLNEAQAINSKGDAYISYQRRVSSFVPWFHS